MLMVQLLVRSMHRVVPSVVPPPRLQTVVHPCLVGWYGECTAPFGRLGMGMLRWVGPRRCPV